MTEKEVTDNKARFLSPSEDGQFSTQNLKPLKVNSGLTN